MDAMRRSIAAPEGVTVSYLVIEGTEPAVVILHGLAGSGLEFLPTARALAGRKILLVDQRGHGFSTKLPSDTSRGAFVGDVVRVIEAEALDAVDLVGQSMGAHTAMLVAAARPELVRRLVLLEGNEGGGSAEESAAMGVYFRSWNVPFKTRDEAQAALGNGPPAHAWASDLEERPDGFYPRFDPDVMVSTMIDVSAPRWDEWESVTAPTLVVYADQGMFTDEQKDSFVTRGVSVTRVDLPGASHDAHLDAFDQWIQALTRFINAH